MLVLLRCKFGTNFLKWDFTTQAIAEWKEAVLKDSTITKASHDDTFKKKILHELTSNELPDVVSIHENRVRKLHTTRSWDYMGVSGSTNMPLFSSSKPLWELGEYGKNVIVGILDTGVWPESPSFNDDGMGEIPSKWKLIGARYHLRGYLEGLSKKEKKVPGILSARDDDGHGTHTASTLAGRLVQNATVVGRFAQGTAAGGVPGARVAAYKACWGGDDGYCHESDLIAAMDQAVHDGVDVISISNGGEEYANDVVALAALSAVKKGVTVVASAGNEGVKGMGNSDPWLITVGASSMDRWGSARLSLGNGTTFTVCFSFVSMAAFLYCMDYSLDREKVQGKIVLCMRKRGKDTLAQSTEVRDAGGAGMILYEDVKDEQELMDYWHYVPSIHISAKDALAPDITAPGVDILAAWPPNVDLGEGRGRGNFNFQSGTSMSCPHVAAVAALLKSYHQDWSPAAIKSAILTTGKVVLSINH
ncbi:subtilisin-like protease SBT5.4 [Selaginella moellendorffii]|uniref:subtilisin-like protease SBT5.4 n=1 Tax=Selaginella moellendorffii TaxID=88036 RepID=UPI000D1C87DB|nr:subtilisin-like protease SBT5.4 [Selaginella moellendorffii]|eukprot:XP_024541843.1 subtilisin-like protease SBT5.4 [Selaginella moellendorffii]